MGKFSSKQDSTGTARPHWGQQPVHLERIRREFEVTYPDAPVLAFLENVPSMPAYVKKQYDKITGTKPVLFETGRFGWVQRRRYYWGEQAPEASLSRMRTSCSQMA